MRRLVSSPGKCVSHIDFSADPRPIMATRKNRSIDYTGYFMDMTLMIFVYMYMYEVY